MHHKEKKYYFVSERPCDDIATQTVLSYLCGTRMKDVFLWLLYIYGCCGTITLFFCTFSLLCVLPFSEVYLSLPLQGIRFICIALDVFLHRMSNEDLPWYASSLCIDAKVMQIIKCIRFSLHTMHTICKCLLFSCNLICLIYSLREYEKGLATETPIRVWHFVCVCVRSVQSRGIWLQWAPQCISHELSVTCSSPLEPTPWNRQWISPRSVVLLKPLQQGATDSNLANSKTSTQEVKYTEAT